MNVLLLRQSFELVAPHASQLTDLFYETLFSRYPGVKPLFEGVSMKKQRGKLVGSLAYIVKNLENGAELSAYLKAMGRRHLAYGTKESHYPAVGECLLAALAKVAGPAWNRELEQAWTEAYQAVAGLMMEGARGEQLDSCA